MGSKGKRSLRKRDANGRREKGRGKKMEGKGRKNGGKTREKGGIIHWVVRYDNIHSRIKSLYCMSVAA